MNGATRRNLSILHAAVTLGFVRAAHAQAGPDSIQIGLGASLLSHTGRNVADGSYDRESSSTQVGYGDGNSATGEIGYRFGELVVGASVAVGGGTLLTNGTVQKQRRTAWIFAGPKIDYVFLPASRVRPFVGAAAGVIRWNELEQVRSFYGGNDLPPVWWTKADIAQTGVKLELRVGIRGFATPWFSVDPAFFMAAMYLKGQGPASYMDGHAEGYSLGLSLAASSWVHL
jgi:hypothetical protein